MICRVYIDGHCEDGVFVMAMYLNSTYHKVVLHEAVPGFSSLASHVTLRPKLYQESFFGESRDTSSHMGTGEGDL